MKSLKKIYHNQFKWPGKGQERGLVPRASRIQIEKCLQSLPERTLRYIQIKMKKVPTLWNCEILFKKNNIIKINCWVSLVHCGIMEHIRLIRLENTERQLRLKTQADFKNQHLQEKC